ncbi:MAG: invasion-associated locus B family protein [Rhizobiales bacterium 62-47]|nr:invasion associated locus B family protein [Hyphomicrobiales bacterium]OJY11270.1 MAG: invasion-associated locus B family protein [Rhizobiales bacterium 62-47]
MARSHPHKIRRRSAKVISLALLSVAAIASLPAVAEISPRGQRNANDIKYGDWRKLCFKAAGAPTLCRTSITGTYDTGQVAVRFDLIEREGDRTARLQIFVPVGMYLRIPAKLTVDDRAPHPIPYNWCLSNGCIAGDVASPKLIKEMERGKALTLEVVDSNLLSLTTSLPLARFASARKEVPAQTLEQDIEE